MSTDTNAAPAGGGGGGNAGAGAGGTGDGGAAATRDEIARTIEEVRKLQRFSAKKGQPIPSADLEHFFDLAAKYGTVDWTPTVEAQFWATCQAVNAAALPTTVETISTTYRFSESGAIKRFTVLVYVCVAISVLIVLANLYQLIVTQKYWSSGASIVDQIKLVSTSVSDMSSKVQELKKEVANLENEETVLNDGKKKLDTALEDARVRLSKTFDLPGKEAIEKQIETIEADRAENAAARLARQRNYITVSSDYYVEEKKQEMRRSELCVLTKELEVWIGTKIWNATFAIFVSPPDPVAGPQASTECEQDEMQEAILLVTARNELISLSTFWLPMLYGLLGALTHISRTILGAVRSATFGTASIVYYLMRVPLGMVAGVAIGWFLASAPAVETAAGAADAAAKTGFLDLSTIGPFALAFVAGYSVELLFTGMDRIIGAFTRPAT